MRLTTTLLILAIAVTNVYSAPQLISYKDGKIGVNFGGYHAGVGLGGLLGGGGAGGGLFAEAGTPYGQAARAGLGGTVDGNGGATAGGLYAGATAGGNVKASAGLAGGVEGEKAAGSGYATAQSGNHYAGSGLGGESSIAGSGGFTFAGTKSIHTPGTVVKETEVSIIPAETVQPIHKKVHTEINLEAGNEISHVPRQSTVYSGVEANAEVGGGINVNTNAKPVIIKEVSNWKPHGIYQTFLHANQDASSFFRIPQWMYIRPWWIPQQNVYKRTQVYVEPQPVVVEKHIIHTHYKPHRHHFRKTAYVGGYIGADAGGNVGGVPAVEKRINVDSQSSANVGGDVNVHNRDGGEVQYTKQVSIARNPQFFRDIFNIPILTLNAVSDFLGGATANTNISVQKTVHAGAYA